MRDLFSATPDPTKALARVESSLRVANGVVACLAQELAEANEEVIKACTDALTWRQIAIDLAAFYQDESALKRRVRHLEAVIDSLRDDIAGQGDGA
jgi:hypothetical protein